MNGRGGPEIEGGGAVIERFGVACLDVGDDDLVDRDTDAVLLLLD